MERSIIAFWAVVFLVLVVLRCWPGNVIARAAFMWFGPLPKQAETWAQFQFRWAIYSFSWLCQCCFLLTVLWLSALWFPGVDSATWFQVAFFALPLGAGAALLAVVGFLIKAAKARLIGPNPTWTNPLEESNVA